MSQRGVHLVVGRLVTDGVFRRRVERGGSAFLAGLTAEGVELNRAEIAGLIEVDPRVWANVAKQLDKASNTERGATGGAIGGAPGEGGGRAHRALTARQQRVLAGVCDGLRNQEIAAELGVSESAIKASLQQIFRKLSVRTRVQLVRLALDESARNLSRRRDAGAQVAGVVADVSGNDDGDGHGSGGVRANGAHVAGGARSV